jgi:hypothetical protein
MKNKYFLILILLFPISCGGGQNQKDSGKTQDAETANLETVDTQSQEEAETSAEEDFLQPCEGCVEDSNIEDQGNDNQGTDTQKKDTVTGKGEVGDPCTKASDCNEGSVCLTSLPNGYCSVKGCQSGSCPSGSECFQFDSGDTYCLKTCTSSSECREDEGYVCDSDNTCWASQQTGNSPIGGACGSDTDCKDSGAYCYPQEYKGEPTGFTNGYCILFGCKTGSCPEGSDCFKVSSDGTTACLKTCEQASECRQDEGYSCSSSKICWPFCKDSTNCPIGYTCIKGDEFCGSNDLLCSATNKTGYCADPLVCQNGQCKEFEFNCTDKQFEPNETISKAQTAPEGWTEDLQLCSGDLDYYKITIPAGNLATLGIEFQNKVGDIDLAAYDSNGDFLGTRWWVENYDDRSYETDNEYLTGISIKNDTTMFFKVKPYKTAVNDYKMLVEFNEYKDGAKCTDFYPVDECKGLPSGNMKIYQFPFPDPSDGFVGDGYMFDSLSNYRWARREVIMMIRYAIKSVQDKFSGTNPLGLIDICQIDGITPGYDVGDPRHPESTHDQGGNIDVAYYQTGKDNHARVICDSKGGSNDGYFCTSVTNHIVDLPRTAFFMMKLAEYPRFRVAGADKLIAPLILAEAKSQKDKGWFTSSTYNTLVKKLAYGSGWEFHHHHIHISFLWWNQTSALKVKKEPATGCGFRMPGDGPWPKELHKIKK